MADLHKVREWIFESDNRACFIERERILNHLSEEMRDYQGEDKYALILERVLAEVSTPIFDCDYFAGRVVEALPFYEKALKEGKTKEALTELLAGFLIKTNEICGRHTWNYQAKPVLCQASKQYVNIGGENPNEFSGVVLEAAKMSNMAQPQIVVLLKPDANEAFTGQVFEALAYLTDKMNIYNYDSISKALMLRGVPEEIAKDFTYSACSRMPPAFLLRGARCACTTFFFCAPLQSAGSSTFQKGIVTRY